MKLVVAHTFLCNLFFPYYCRSLYLTLSTVFKSMLHDSKNYLVPLQFLYSYIINNAVVLGSFSIRYLSHIYIYTHTHTIQSVQLGYYVIRLAFCVITYPVNVGGCLSTNPSCSMARCTEQQISHNFLFCPSSLSCNAHSAFI